MAIPSTPTNPYVQTGNGQVFISADISAGATSYSFQRGIDGVTFAFLATAAVPQYLDATAALGTQYFYQMAAVNADGTSPYTIPQSAVPTPTSEVSLGQLRLMAQQRADRVNSNFVTVPEWNTYINQSMFELYDLLVTVYEDYYIAPAVSFLTNGNQFLYPLPDGTNYNAAAPFYKLIGVDLGLNTANNAYVTIDKFNFVDRNRFVYPNSNSTIYGVFNMQYRVMGSNIEFIPTPTANQTIRLWYVPRLRQLLQDSDITSTGISGWIEYVITDAAIKALQKEESDVTVLGMQKMALIKRIEDSASNRDPGRPDTISNSRRGDWYGGNGWGNNPVGGF